MKQKKNKTNIIKTQQAISFIIKKSKIVVDYDFFSKSWFPIHILGDFLLVISVQLTKTCLEVFIGQVISAFGSKYFEISIFLSTSEPFGGVHNIIRRSRQTFGTLGTLLWSTIFLLEEADWIQINTNKYPAGIYLLKAVSFWCLCC